jgi:hypothetical protein
MKNSPTATAIKMTPSGTPSPIPILSAFERWLDADGDVSVAVGAGFSGLGTVASVDVVLGVVDEIVDDDVSLTKLYETGAGSSVYLFDTPNITPLILLP